jgi:hypothetical protein
MTKVRNIRFLIVLAALVSCGASVTFIGQPPALQAQTREEVVLWESIKDSDHTSDYLAYLDKYPDGTFAPIAKRRVAELTTFRLSQWALTGEDLDANDKPIHPDSRPPICKDSYPPSIYRFSSRSHTGILLLYAYTGANRGDKLVVGFITPGQKEPCFYCFYSSPFLPDARTRNGVPEGCGLWAFLSNGATPGEWHVTIRVNGIEQLTVPFTVTEN